MDPSHSLAHRCLLNPHAPEENRDLLTKHFRLLDYEPALPAALEVFRQVKAE